MTKKPKQEPLTVELMAKKLGVTKAAIYRAVRVQRARDADPLLPLYKLAKRNDISENVATTVITVFKMEGLPGLREMPKQHHRETTDRGRFAVLISTAEDEDVRKAVAASEKKRKSSISGVSARMSKAKA